MHIANLRRVEGSAILTILSVMLEAVGLADEAEVNISIDGDRLVLEQRNRRTYSLEELLAQCDSQFDFSPEDKEWLESVPVGKEVL